MTGSIRLWAPIALFLTDRRNGGGQQIRQLRGTG
jgi:hypothetical protein